MTTRPRVTVLMSVFNGEPFVAEAVESVLLQTFEDFEFLIYEDKSTDASLQVLRRYPDPRIRLVENTENRGLTRNLISGMNLARGDFVARTDADDVCAPHRLATQVAYMDANPQIGVLGSAVIFFTDSGKEFVAHQPLEHDEIMCTLLYGFTMLHPSVMIRKADFDRHKLNYDPAFTVSQDHDLWVRAVRKVRFANVYEPVLRMREHTGKIGRTRKPLQQELSNVVRQRQLAELGVTATAQELSVFGDHNTLAEPWTLKECETFEALLLRIFDANTEACVYDQDTLVRMGVHRFRATCRQLLIAGNRAGRYYWRSKIRRLDDPSLRQIIGLALRSLSSGRSSLLVGGS